MAVFWIHARRNEWELNVALCVFYFAVLKRTCVCVCVRIMYNVLGNLLQGQYMYTFCLRCEWRVRSAHENKHALLADKCLFLSIDKTQRCCWLHSTALHSLMSLPIGQAWLAAHFVWGSRCCEFRTDVTYFLPQHISIRMLTLILLCVRGRGEAAAWDSGWWYRHQDNVGGKTELESSRSQKKAACDSRAIGI